MPPPEKKFVKYAFDEGNSKPREQRRESRDQFKQRDSNQQNRGRRHVSYTQKSTSRQNVLRDMINSFILFEKPTPRVEEMMKKYPKYFNPTSKEPEPFNPESLNSYLTLMGKKPIERQAKTYAPIQPEQESDPNWDSDSDIEGGIQSKAIDPSIIEKAAQKLGTVRQLRQDELRRHQKQFLEDYYRQKHQDELQKQKIDQNTEKGRKPNSQQSIDQNEPNEWTEYQEKQVEDFVNMGFIQKIEEDENDDFGDSDFSVQEEKSQSGSSKKSSQDEDDDIFGDEGPTTIVKKKEHGGQSSEHKTENMGTVVINSHIFSRIAQAVGIPPGACIWIIRNNKNLRYKVSTQFMDEMYRLNNFCESLPWVSLNHSEFVHNGDVEKEKGLEIFKNFNARKHHNHHNGGQHHKGGNGGRNFENNKRKFQYKPGSGQGTSQRTHLNKN